MPNAEIRASLPLELAQLHAHLRTLRPLVEAVGKVQPSALTTLRTTYATAVGTALSDGAVAAVSAAVEAQRSRPGASQRLQSTGSSVGLQSRGSYQLQGQASSFRM